MEKKELKSPWSPFDLNETCYEIVHNGMIFMLLKYDDGTWEVGLEVGGGQLFELSKYGSDVPVEYVKWSALEQVVYYLEKQAKEFKEMAAKAKFYRQL